MNSQRAIPSLVTVAVTVCCLLVSPSRASAVVSPAPDRAFCPDPTTGSNIVARMVTEAGNPLLAETVVQFVNFTPVVDVDGDGNKDFAEWSGILIAPEWVLTCAHALQGTNGRGGGIITNDLFCLNTVSFPNASPVPVAEFFVNPAWQFESYSNGFDIALVRLSLPITNVTAFPRLAAAPFVPPTAVMFAGYGYTGNGDTGTTGPFGTLQVGINSLDVVGGGMTQDGFGNPTTPYPNHVGSIGYMDFDKWERLPVNCGGGVTNPVDVVLSAFSTMGTENAVVTPVLEPCPVANPPAMPDVFSSFSCDFLPVGGDSGGPAFLWPTAPNGPAAGYFMTGIPTVLGVGSLLATGVGGMRNGVYGNVAGYTLVEPHLGWIYQTVRSLAEQDSDGDGRTDEEEWLVGSDPYSVPRAPATFLEQTWDILIQNIRILQERLVGANETEIEFTADLANTDTGRYFDLSLNVVRENLPVLASVTDPQLNYAALSELGTAAAGATDTLVVRVANADVAAVRDMILSGNLLEVHGFEEQVYSGPTRFIDAPTDEAFEGLTGNVLGQLVLIFGLETSLIDGLNSGDLLIADTAPGGYRPRQPSPTEPFAVPYLSQQLPFEIASVSMVEGKVHVAGQKLDLNQILKSGTFVASDENFNGGGRDLLDPPVENTYTAAEKEDRDEQARFMADADPNDSRLADLAGMNAIPWRFNEVEITPHLRLSGQVLLRSSGLRFQASFREFALKRATVGIDAGIAASMVLETTGTNHNTSAPLIEKQKELAKIPLPGISVTIGGVPFTIAPAFVLSVGAEANAPAGLSVPFESSVTLGTEIGWADGQTFVTPIKEFITPHVSDPTVFDAVAASAKAWAEARLEVNISLAGGLAKAGPSLAARVEAGFEVAPLSDPWWTMDVDADLVGAFEMDLLGFTVTRAEATEEIATFFHRDAGGPLVPASSGQKATAKMATFSEIGPKAGENTRWALAFAAAPNSSANYAKGFVTPLTGGGYFVGGGAAIPKFLGVISSDGVAQWLQTFPSGAKPVDAVQLDDGALMVVGELGFDWWLAKYDTSGNRLWVQSYRTQADLRDLAVGTAGDGAPEFYLAGFQSLTSVRQSNPFVLKLDENGNLVWCKAFTLADDDETYSIQLLQDGNLLLTGSTDWNVGTDLFIGANWNGLVMKITPDGDVVWATAVPGRWGMSFLDSAEAPDGTLYAVGDHNDLVTDLYPSILVGKFTPDGELIEHVLIGEDPDWDDELPHGGDTPYDTAARVAWRNGSLIVVGNTGLGGNVSAWVASLTDELGVEWFSAFDGPGACTFQDLAVTGTGIAAMGWIDDPWPGRFDNRTPAWLVSLPWEGMMRFHPHAGVRGSYLQPRVYLSSAQRDFIGKTEDGYGRQLSVRTASVPFVVSNSVPVAGANVMAGVVSEFTTARLERLEPSILTSYEEWLVYHQLTGSNALVTADVEPDGSQNLWEFFEGTDPLSASSGSTNTPVGLAIQYDAATDTVEITFRRARVAAGQPFNLLYSLDLANWMPAGGISSAVIGTDDLFEWLSLTLPAPDPDHAFFRLELPIAP